jgi:hypothetical protein
MTTEVARLLALREKHQAAVRQIKSTLKPGDPKRHALLVKADAVARLIRSEEQTAGKK